MLPFVGDLGSQPAWVLQSIEGLENEQRKIDAARFAAPKKVDKRPPPGRTAPTLTSSRKQ